MPIFRMFVNSSRVRLLNANKRFAERTADGMLVLDAGAGRGPRAVLSLPSI